MAGESTTLYQIIKNWAKGFKLDRTFCKDAADAGLLKTMGRLRQLASEAISQ